MIRRFFPLLTALLFTAAAGAGASPAYCPLDPVSLRGPAIFTDAESLAAGAARQAGLEFTPDSRPLPPQVILTLDNENGDIRKRNGILVWRGDMLPDQLAPAEAGTLVRKRRTEEGLWKTTRRKENCAPDAMVRFQPADRPDPPVPLPAMIIETPYRLGTIGPDPVILVLWRSTDEGSPPLGGALVLSNPSPALRKALQAQIPAFDRQADWAAEFDARSP